MTTLFIPLILVGAVLLLLGIFWSEPKHTMRRTYEIVEQANGDYTVLYNGKIFESDGGWRSTNLTKKEATVWINRHIELYGGRLIN